MASDLTRHVIWQELLDIARCLRYYDALGQRYRRFHVAFRFLLGLASTGAPLLGCSM